MALVSVQAIVAAGTTPAVVTPSASDTFSTNDIGTRGIVLRVITTGTATNVQVVDPGTTPLGNAYNPVPVACPSTGVRMIYVGPAAVNSSGVATVTFSGALTGVTYEAYRY